MGMFDDLMEGGKGPGVFGTGIAVVVLVGFACLYFLVFDSGMQGGDKRIEAVIRDQQTEIESMQERIVNLQKRYDKAEQVRAIDSKLEDANRDLRVKGGALDNSRAEVARLQQAVKETDAAYEDYQRKYREQIRGAATGRKYAELKTAGGRSYRDVVVKRVDSVGVSFTHESGSGRADFEDLALEFQEEFQYDPKEKLATLNREKGDMKQHLSSVGGAEAAAAQERAARAEASEAAKIESQKVESAKLQERITQLDVEIRRAESRLSAEQSKTSGVKNTELYRNKVDELRAQRAAAAARLNEIR